jgi:tRNA(Arg) A34 adenosine deaminase TadA
VDIGYNSIGRQPILLSFGHTRTPKASGGAANPKTRQVAEERQVTQTSHRKRHPAQVFQRLRLILVIREFGQLEYEGLMSKSKGPNRRDFIVTTAGSAGALMSTVPAAQAREAYPLGPGFDIQSPLKANWREQLGAVTEIDYDTDAKELKDAAVRERHRIYCYLLMKLVYRFWNGNKNGPLGIYPQRDGMQLAGPMLAQDAPRLYRGDINERADRDHVKWDRYLGHNIACIAVDGNGHIIDFDFNHNAFFRSSAEHAESRLVRRLFSLTDIFDSWKTGARFNGKPHAASLGEVTLYTSLESCAQCSGVMSLAGVKQIIYMQNDFTAYKIGNIIYKLANRMVARDGSGNVARDDKGNVLTIPGAPVPIPASEVELEEFKTLNDGNLDFTNKMLGGNEFFFKSPDGAIDRDPSITSFLCTDQALGIFKTGGEKLDSPVLQSKNFPYKDEIPKDRDSNRVLANDECLTEARDFFQYVDVEGYRGSPHKL